MPINDTHDPLRKSWIESANKGDTDFPIQNLPFGIFERQGDKRSGIAIGDQIFDLAKAVSAGLFSGDPLEAAQAAIGSELNPLLALGNDAASVLRKATSDILTEGSSAEEIAKACLVAQGEVKMCLPVKIGNFTDFLCSDEHAIRMSQKNSLPPAYEYLPIAYHGRTNTVMPSGTPVRRPKGQFRAPDGEVKYGPEPFQDFELELGIFVGKGSQLGEPILIEDAADHLFGYCLLNDWSARAILAFEILPLGPFLGKSLMTSISTWIVTTEALAPFTAPARSHANATMSHQHLMSKSDQSNGGYNINMYADISTEKMRINGEVPHNMTSTNFTFSYWTPAQMLTHHASNGCALESGDLFGSGTVSGVERCSWATYAEICEKGDKTVQVGTETRNFLDDRDEVIFRACAEKEDFIAIGFGECRGTVLPASPL